MNAILFLLTIGLLCQFLVTQAADIDLSNIDDSYRLPMNFPKNSLTPDRLLEFKCLQVAGKENGLKAVNELKAASFAFHECTGKINKRSPLTTSIILDFIEFCKEKPKLIECVKEFNSKLTPCLDKEERDQDVLMRIVAVVQDTICDQIFPFFAAKGPECIEANSRKITNCLDEKYSSYVPAKGITNLTSILPKFVMGQQQCDTIKDLQTCIVSQLQKCETKTPANISESMFRSIRNSFAACRTKTAAGSGSNSLLINLNSIWMLMFVTAVATYFNRKTII